MRVLRATACLLLSACGEPRLATVAIVPEPPLERDASVIRDASRMVDAARDAAVARPRADAQAASCVVLPDLVIAGTVGQATNDAVITRIVRIEECPGFEVDGGLQQPAYTYERLDGQPMLLADQPYALSWPVSGQSSGVVAFSGATLTAPTNRCERGEPLVRVEVAFGSSTCVEVRATEDAPMVKLVDGIALGLGTVPFSLCPGRCAQP